MQHFSSFHWCFWHLLANKLHQEKIPTGKWKSTLCDHQLRIVERTAIVPLQDDSGLVGERCSNSILKISNILQKKHHFFQTKMRLHPEVIFIPVLGCPRIGIWPPSWGHSPWKKSAQMLNTSFDASGSQTHPFNIGLPGSNRIPSLDSSSCRPNRPTCLTENKGFKPCHVCILHHSYRCILRRIWKQQPGHWCQDAAVPCFLTHFLQQFISFGLANEVLNHVDTSSPAPTFGRIKAVEAPWEVPKSWGMRCFE